MFRKYGNSDRMAGTCGFTSLIHFVLPFLVSFIRWTAAATLLISTGYFFMYSMCRLYVTSSDDSSKQQSIVIAAGCFTSKCNFLMGGGFMAVNPNLEGTFLIFLNRFLSCPSIMPYINICVAIICLYECLAYVACSYTCVG